MKFLNSTQKIKIFLGGRGSGKTTCEGGEQYLLGTQMPRSKGFLSSTTYNQLLTKTLPAMTGKWEEMGWKEGEDYVVGVRPPSSWAKAYDEPRKYTNIISIANGRRIELLSMDRPDLARGGSYTDGAIDEMALVPQEHINKVLLPSLRGNMREFGSHPRYRSLRGYTSIPWKPSGYYILDYETKAAADPDRYLFIESNAYDNLAVLGQDYLDLLESEMSYLEFLVEVMNMRVRKVKDAFYHKFDPERHIYSVKYKYEDTDSGIITKGLVDPYYNPSAILDISFDFSGYFNPALVFQEGLQTDGRAKRLVEYAISQHFVRTEDGKVGELVDKICEHYSQHKSKYCRLWGEPRGHDPKPDNPKTLFMQIQERFKRNGWNAEIRVKPGQVRAHKERNYYMNEVLSEMDPSLPILRFNEETCKDAIIAMQVTAVKDDFQKDKSKETDRNFPQEHAPHFTDLLDYYLMQKHGANRSRWQSRPAMTARIG